MNTREKICEAAMRIAAQDSVTSLTIDRVAEETGLSKGGVTHHFGSKDELLQGMVEHFADQLEPRLTSAVADDVHTRFRWFRGVLDIVYPRKKKKGDVPFNRKMMALLTLSCHSREVPEPIKKFAKKLQQRLLDDDDGELDQLMLWLAMDGLFLWEFVGLISPSSALHKRVVAEMRERISSDAVETR